MGDGEDISTKRYCLLVVKKKKKSTDLENGGVLEMVLKKGSDEIEVLEESNF